MSFRLRTTRFGARPTDSVSAITQIAAPTIRPSVAGISFARRTPITQAEILSGGTPTRTTRRFTPRSRRVSKATTFRPTTTRPTVRPTIVSAPAPSRVGARGTRVFRPSRTTPITKRAGITVAGSRIVQQPSGQRLDVLAPPTPIPREFIGAPPRREAGVTLFTPETFRQDVSKETTPEGVKTTTRTTLPFTTFTFAEQEAIMKTAEQKEIERRRKVLGTVTAPKDVGAFQAFPLNIALTRPEARGLALEEFGAGFASPFVELGETAVDISRGDFEGRAREQPTFLSDLISVGGAQVRGFFGGEAPAPSESFEAFSKRQAGKTPQRATGELFGEVALTVATLGVGKAIQLGVKAAPTGIRTVTSIFKGAGKTGLPKFNVKAVQGATKTKSQSVLKKDLTKFNKRVNKIDQKFGKLDQRELKINKSKFLSKGQKTSRVNKVRKERFKLNREEAVLRKEGNKFVGLVRESSIAKAPAKRLFAGRKEQEFTSAIFGLGKGAGRQFDDFGKGFSSFTKGKRPPSKPPARDFPAKPKPPTEGRPIVGRGGQATIQVAKTVQKVKNGRVTSSKLKQVSFQIIKQEKLLAKKPKTAQVLKQQKQLSKQKTKIKQAQKTIKKRKQKGQTADVSFEQVFRFPQKLRPRAALRTTPVVSSRFATRQGLQLIPFQTLRPVTTQRQVAGLKTVVPTRTRQIFEPVRPTQRFQDDFTTIFKPITKPPVTKQDTGFVPTTPTTTTTTTKPPPTTTTRTGITPPILLFGDGQRRRAERIGKKSKVGKRLFDIADEPFGEVTVGLGFFIEQRGEETIAESLGLDDNAMFEPITRQERQARKRLGINGKNAKNGKNGNGFTEGIDLESFF